MKKSRIYRNAGAPDGVLVFNYARSKVSLPNADEIETLVPKAAMDALTNGDAEPFFKVEAIDFPAKGSGGVYDGSFFKSFINVCKERPIPGSKRGHEYSSRPASDFYTVGGRVDSSDGGKTGTAYMKIYIPPVGDPTENAAFIRDARAGMVHFSLVTKPDFNVKSEDDGMGGKVQVRHFTASKGYERNDAMEYGAGAMNQVVNSSGIALDLDAARALIESGQFDTQSNVDGEPIQGGIVHRSALRRLASRANDSDRAALGELISMIDKAKNGRKTVETKEEALAILKNAVDNSQISLPAIAKAVGLETLLRNAEDEANAATILALNSKLGDKPLEKLDEILAENAASAEVKIAAAVREIAGDKTLKNAAGKDVVNPSHAYAVKACNGLSGEVLKNAVEELKKDPVLISLNAQRADGNSALYRVEAGGAKPVVANESGDGIITHEIGKKE